MSLGGGQYWVFQRVNLVLVCDGGKQRRLLDGEILHCTGFIKTF